MSSYNFKKIHDEIHSTLLDTGFLKEYHIKNSLLKDCIEGPDFTSNLRKLLENKDYSCSAVYFLLEDILKRIWEPGIPDEPLKYIYQFVLSLSFPNSVEIRLDSRLNGGCYLYLKTLRMISQYEKTLEDNSFQSMYPLNLITPEEENSLMNISEYRRFVLSFNKQYIYEMMKLNYEIIGHNTLDHVCGVHYLAVFIAKQLLDKDIYLDLGRVSGAAAGHDIGKYGCRSFESNRVAYLHYYYTDQWFKNNNIPYIGHIALNHSVWDLELENLSIESLILIYCDFRVKNVKTPQGQQQMQVTSLDSSFDVILNKLDNVDEAKERRYKRVYIKLKDFEGFLLNLGINIHPYNSSLESCKNEQTFYALLHGKDIANHLNYTAIYHNVHLMYKFRDETSLNEIIEIARAQKDPKILREFLDIIQEYSTYLTQKQKLIVIRFLYEKLVHPEEDIRKQSAQIIGSLIALFDEGYRKEIPTGLKITAPEVTSIELVDQYMKLFMYPDHKIIPLHRRWIRYSMSTFISSLFNCCEKVHIGNYREIILNYYRDDNVQEIDIKIVLMEALKFIPLESESFYFDMVINYLIAALEDKNDDIRISALDSLNFLTKYIEKESESYRLLHSILTNVEMSAIPAENYLYLKISDALSVENDIHDNVRSFYIEDINKASDMFLNNLKTETNWVTKKFHVELLLDYAIENDIIDKLYVAMHFCNLLKVSAVENVRSEAGEALVKVFPYLPIEQRNDIAIELLRTLEIEGAQFTKYIPSYLGQIIVFLKPLELDEIIDDLIEKIKHANTQINSLLLKTIGVFISNYSKYKDIFKEEEDKYNRRLSRMLGILLNGLVHDNLQIKQVSFSVIGKDIFGASSLTLQEKYNIFQLIAKKTLTLITDVEENELLFLTNSAGLNHVYRFISDYRFLQGEIELEIIDKVAFFPGSFDPFTLGHKEIARAIRDLGFEVYLAVDEFSWSKRMQPNLIRKNIMNMSIADEMDIYIYPEDFPVNLANPNDLNSLRNNFRQSEVYIVVGSDVILNASAYRNQQGKNTVTDFAHIIFERRNDEYDKEMASNLEKALEGIKQPVIKLNLPPQYEDISSTQIRNYIDENRDISKLIDPLSQKYVYNNNLYRREPQYKSLLQTISYDIEVRDHFNYELINSIASLFHKNYNEAFKNIETISRKPNANIILIRDIKDHGKILGYSIFHWIPSDSIYQEFKDSSISQCIRENYAGRIISLDGIFLCDNVDIDHLYQIILSETLAYWVKNDYGYGIFTNRIERPISGNLYHILKLHGFQELPCSKDQDSVLAVNMTNPCSLYLDVQTIIKEPFRSNENVKAVISKTRTRLQEALTNLYPGHLIISFDRDIVEETLVKKICRENEVPPVPLNPRRLGPSMCVPFGNILNRAIVPNTVTKTLHTEKMFVPDMNRFTIGPFPYYLDLIKQIRMIHSFNRPVILVDDLLNKGYRIKALDPILKSENIHVKKIIVGMLSGRGKELMEIQNREVDSAYFIPKLRLWFNEALLYPFIGGDTLWRGVFPKKNLIPSVNLILPYTSPSFIKGVTTESIYNLSLVCIENALDILKVLEMTYQKINERKLTLSLLGEVFLYPRCPDQGKNVSYDFTVNPSTHLEKDLELLKRLESSFIHSNEGR